MSKRKPTAQKTAVAAAGENIVHSKLPNLKQDGSSSVQKATNMPILNQALTPSIDEKFQRANIFLKDRATAGQNPKLNRAATGQPLILSKPAPTHKQQPTTSFQEMIEKGQYASSTK